MNAARVGMFMVVILVVLGFFILKIEDIPMTGSVPSNMIDVSFDSVAGLDEKSAVRVAGVRVGKVASIRLGADGRAVVTLAVSDEVVLYEGATARVVELGLLGEKYVELIPGNVGGPALHGSEIVLNGGHTASIGQVTEQISQIADDVKSVTASMKTALGGMEGERRLVEIVENVRDITERVRGLIAANEMNVSATAENLRAITDQLRVEIPKIAESIDRVANSIGGTVTDNRDDVRVIVENLKSLSSDLIRTNENLESITGQIRSGEGTVGKLIYSDASHEQLNSTLASVEGGVEELRDTLGRINRVDLDLGIRGDYYTGLDESVNGNSRSSLVLDLKTDPALNRSYHFEVIDDPFGRKDVAKRETTVTREDGTTETIVRDVVEFDRDLLFSAQAAWALSDWTVRVGIFDSTGGVGADYRFNDRLKFSGEAFDFGERRFDQPHLRVFSEYTLIKERSTFPMLFVTTGVDNVLNDSAFIVGGGIRWSDDDLKYLIGSIPSGN